MLAHKYGCLWPIVTLIVACESPRLSAQSKILDDPIAAAQAKAAQRVLWTEMAPRAGLGIAGSISDPIMAAQVLTAAERAFPNLAADLENAELLRRAAADPSLRGSLRGRIAETDWIKRNASDGWKAVNSPNAPQNDAYRFVSGKPEGAQLKVHADWHKYIRSMRKDDKAERFVLPDDHYDLVYKELEMHRAAAVRGGLVDEAAAIARQQQRLTKIGRSFSEIDGAVGAATKHYTRITRAVRAAGKTASYVGIAVEVLDGGIAVYEVAIGKSEVDELVTRLGKIVIGGTASWAAGVAGSATIAAGAAGAVPVAVAIVVGAATYLVVDWAIGSLADAARVGQLSANDIKRVWPAGARGVPLDRLYRKPKDPAVLLK